MGDTCRGKFVVHLAFLACIGAEPVEEFFFVGWEYYSALGERFLVCLKAFCVVYGTMGWWWWCYNVVVVVGVVGGGSIVEFFYGIDGIHLSQIGYPSIKRIACQIYNPWFGIAQLGQLLQRRIERIWVVVGVTVWFPLKSGDSFSSYHATTGEGMWLLLVSRGGGLGGGKGVVSSGIGLESAEVELSPFGSDGGGYAFEEVKAFCLGSSCDFNCFFGIIIFICIDGICIVIATATLFGPLPHRSCQNLPKNKRSRSTQRHNNHGNRPLLLRQKFTIQVTFYPWP